MLTGALLFSAAGCGFVKSRTTEETYYNGYLGLTVTVPSGWYMSGRNEINLTADPADSRDFDRLDISAYDGGGGFLDLLTVESKLVSTNDDHAEFSIYAEDYVSVFPTLAEYIEVCSEYYAGDLGGNSFSTLVGVEDVFVNGVAYTRMMFSIENPGNNAPYIEEHYVTQIGRLYMTIYINYWSDSEKSKRSVLDILNHNVTVDASSGASCETYGSI